jgi:hypothetical protein
VMIFPSFPRFPCFTPNTLPPLSSSLLISLLFLHSSEKEIRSKRRAEASRAHRRWAHPQSDLLAILKAVGAYEHELHAHPDNISKFCDENYLLEKVRGGGGKRENFHNLYTLLPPILSHSYSSCTLPLPHSLPTLLLFMHPSSCK